MDTPQPRFENVSLYLHERAVNDPQGLAIAIANRRRPDVFEELSYSSLERCTQFAQEKLEEYGVRKGMRVVLMVTPSPAFFALTFALLRMGAVLVMVDPGMGVRSLKKCLAKADPQAFIGIPKAHLARHVLGWCRGSVRICISVLGSFVGCKNLSFDALLKSPAGAQPIAAPRSGTEFRDVAAILFTSGSTGVPKGALYRQSTYCHQVESLKRTFGFTPGGRELATFPLFALFAPAFGMASIVPAMDASRPVSANPQHLLAAIEKYRCTNLFLNPALLDKLGRFLSKNNLRLSSVQRVLSAGAPIQASVLQRFQSVLSDGIPIYSAYGATEALPMATIHTQNGLLESLDGESLFNGVCVGHAAEGLHIKIIAIDDGPIAGDDAFTPMPNGHIGEICVHGETVSTAYFGDEGANTHAKFKDSQGRLWHRVGDLGKVDAQGRLWMYGRKSQRVVTAQRTYFTVPCEAVANQFAAVDRSALVGVGLKGQQHPVLILSWGSGVSAQQRKRSIAEIKLALAEHPNTVGIETVLSYPRRLPTDVRHNAKIRREVLSLWAARKLNKGLKIPRWLRLFSRQHTLPAA